MNMKIINFYILNIYYKCEFCKYVYIISINPMTSMTIIKPYIYFINNKYIYICSNCNTKDLPIIWLFYKDIKLNIKLMNEIHQ